MNVSVGETAAPSLQPERSYQSLISKLLSQNNSPENTANPQDALSNFLGISLSDSLYVTNEVEAHLGRANTPYGVKSAQGRRDNMEDAYCIQDKLSTPQPCVAGNTAVNLLAEGSPVAGSPVSAGPLDTIPVPYLPEDLAFFGVYDGHGGNEVAQHCSDKLHKHFACQLGLHRQITLGSDDGSEVGISPHGSPDRAQQRSARASLDYSHSDARPATEGLQNLSLGIYHPQVISDALRASFHKTDEELAGTDAGDFVGATAVVAVLGKEHIWIAHCGDSRAVIQRNGEAHALTRDHKPDREDEAARVRAAGGRIVFNSGGYRVMGMLAMSRAIGDHYLRPYVIADPEVVCVERTADDEVLVIATDGLWDVFSCKEASNLAARCIKRSKERGMSRHGACRVAASVLTKVAMERGSRDNITVIVVDIMPQTDKEEGIESGVPSSANSGSSKKGTSQSNSSSLGTYYWLKSQPCSRSNSGKDRPQQLDRQFSEPQRHRRRDDEPARKSPLCNMQEHPGHEHDMQDAAHDVEYSDAAEVFPCTEDESAPTTCYVASAAAEQLLPETAPGACDVSCRTSAAAAPPPPPAQPAPPPASSSTTDFGEGHTAAAAVATAAASDSDGENAATATGVAAGPLLQPADLTATVEQVASTPKACAGSCAESAADASACTTAVVSARSSPPISIHISRGGSDDFSDDRSSGSPRPHKHARCHSQDAGFHAATDDAELSADGSAANMHAVEDGQFQEAPLSV